MPTAEGAKRQGRWLGEIVALLVLVGVAAAAMLTSWSYPHGSVLYPFAIGSLLMLLVLMRLAALIFQGGGAEDAGPSDGEADDETPRQELPLRLSATYAALIFALVFSVNYVWFPIAAWIVGALVLRVIFGCRWSSSILSAFIVSASSSAVFWALNVPLPGPNI